MYLIYFSSLYPSLKPAKSKAGLFHRLDQKKIFSIHFSYSLRVFFVRLFLSYIKSSRVNSLLYKFSMLTSEHNYDMEGRNINSV